MRLRVPDGKSYEVHGRIYKSGEIFEAPDKEGDLWKATGLAEEAGEPVCTIDATVETAPFKRGPGRPRKIEAEAPSYLRRDMRAEDSDD
jgi:hypothetical protein